jgi:hypothetical protein
MIYKCTIIQKCNLFSISNINIFLSVSDELKSLNIHSELTIQYLIELLNSNNRIDINLRTTMVVFKKPIFILNS